MAFDADTWLGAEAGGDGEEQELPDRLKNLLSAGYTKGIWTAKDVPEDDVQLDDVQMAKALEIWLPIIDDCCTASKLDSFKSEKVRFTNWFKAGYGDANDVYDASSKKKILMTDEFKADLLEQGMDVNDPSMLFGFELSVYLARAVAPPETAGGAYGQPPSAMQGAIVAAKTMKRLGVSKTIDDHLEKARNNGDIGPVLRHFQETSHRLSNSSMMPYNGKAANRIQTFVNKSTQNIRDHLAWVIYHQEVRVKYMGRGLPIPELFDVELAMSAKEQAQELRAKGLAPGVASLGSLGSTARSTIGSDGGSSIGPSASAVGGDSMVSEALTIMQTLSATVATLADRMEALESSAKGAGGGGGLKCWFCQSTDHTSATCTHPKAVQYRANKAKKEAEAAAKAAADKQG